MMKQIEKMMLLFALLIPSGTMAQDNEQATQTGRPARVQRMTYEQMTEKMVSELQLDEKQAKKVTKLNKKYKTLIEGQQMERPQGQHPQNGNRPSGRPSGGGGMPGGMGGRGGGFGGGMPRGGMGGRGSGMHDGPRGDMPQGGPGEQNSYDYDKQQTKYDEKIKKILSDEQYEGYLKLKPQFASQRRIREFLMGGQQGLLQGQGTPDGMGRPGGPDSRNTNITYTGATELKTGTTEDSKTYQSSKTDENALLISTKEAVTISQPTISKTGNSDGGDNCSFYGVNAALLVKGGSATTIKGGKITSDAIGANGVFSYGGNGGRNGGQGDGTTVIIEDTEITTMGNGSGGIMTTGGGVTKARNLIVCTSGRSSAPIRTDRGGKLTNEQGHLFHVTNTNAIITLNNVTLKNEDAANVLLSVCADGWQGAGNKATLNANHQQLEGTILVGSDSELKLTLSDGSTFNGCISGNITNAVGKSVSTETGTVNVTLGNDCTWTLTADTYITSLNGDTSRIKTNGHRLFVGGKEM